MTLFEFFFLLCSLTEFWRWRRQFVCVTTPPIRDEGLRNGGDGWVRNETIILLLVFCLESCEGGKRLPTLLQYESCTYIYTMDNLKTENGIFVVYQVLSTRYILYAIILRREVSPWARTPSSVVHYGYFGAFLSPQSFLIYRGSLSAKPPKLYNQKP